uniref:Uncharacterized protein n=1 Tax=Arundo donax TaxID=35708 RepID=A0A0A9EZ66_ARUDO
MSITEGSFTKACASSSVLFSTETCSSAFTLSSTLLEESSFTLSSSSSCLTGSVSLASLPLVKSSLPDIVPLETTVSSVGMTCAIVVISISGVGLQNGSVRGSFAPNNPSAPLHIGKAAAGLFLPESESAPSGSGCTSCNGFSRAF